MGHIIYTTLKGHVVVQTISLTFYLVSAATGGDFTVACYRSSHMFSLPTCLCGSPVPPAGGSGASEEWSLAKRE